MSLHRLGPGAAGLALGYRPDEPGHHCQFRDIVALELDANATPDDRRSAIEFAGWIRASFLGGIRPGPVRTIMPLSLDGCTRRSVVVGESDTLMFPVTEKRRWRGLTLWCAGLRMPKEGAPILSIDVSIDGRWRPYARIPVDHALQWREERGGPLPRGVERQRVAVQGESAAIAVGEPLLVQDRSGRPRHNLILIDLDTVRADRLGCYGYTDRPTSARFDSLIQQKGFVVFEQATSPGASTVPATVRFLSSRYREDPLYEVEIPASITMLAQRMHADGYYCAGVTGGGLLRVPGFERGFQEYYWSKGFGKVEDSFPKAVQWLRDAKKPFFLFLHTYEAHTPYTRPTFCRELPRGRLPDVAEVQDFPAGTESLSPLTAEERRYVEAAYDGGVRQATDAVADLFSVVDSLSLWDTTVIIVVSDHGEEFWEHFPVYARHGHSLYAELVDVPFLLYAPDLTPYRRIKTEATTVDLVPTVAELLGLEWDGVADGVSLIPLFHDQPLTRRIPIMAHLRSERGGVEAARLVKAGHALIQAFCTPEQLRCDPFVMLHKDWGRELYWRDTDLHDAKLLACDKTDL